MPRRTVKLLLVDPDRRLLLLRGRDTTTGAHHWYPVGGGIEADESGDEAAAREAWEETGLEGLPPGMPVWTRDAHYEYSGRSYDVHETWLHHDVARFDPAPARLSDYESGSIVGFHWWTVGELRGTGETVFPADLGDRFAQLVRDGFPTTPVDIGDR